MLGMLGGKGLSESKLSAVSVVMVTLAGLLLSLPSLTTRLST